MFRTPRYTSKALIWEMSDLQYHRQNGHVDFFSNDIAAPKDHVISQIGLAVEREPPMHKIPKFQAASIGISYGSGFL